MILVFAGIEPVLLGHLHLGAQLWIAVFIGSLFTVAGFTLAGREV